ncbi:MAG: rhodanese-like domain-containing protein [Actinobacteria bacterium]|nr:rhodanese-like domain-containing protein [Actinomycetota bacterium]
MRHDRMAFSNRRQSKQESEAMVKSRRLFLVTLVLIAVLLSATVAVAGCGSSTTTTSATTSATTTSSGSVIGDRALQVEASNPTSGDYANNTITGVNLAQKLNDPAQASQIYLLDVRSKTDYATGHIKGATQVDFASWATPENLAKLPKDKKIVVICYTGNTAAQTASGLRMLGYDAGILKEGMMGWTQEPATASTIAALNSASNPTVTTPNPVQPVDAPPSTTFTPPADADYSTLAAKANAVMAKMPTSGDYANYTIAAGTVNTTITGANKSTVFLLDVRAAADYAKGHIDGATNIPLASLFMPENMKLLPKDKKIIVVCYTGNTAAQAMFMLNMLDYDAATLKFGMMGWNGTGKDAYIQEIQSANNPVVTGP